MRKSVRYGEKSYEWFLGVGESNHFYPLILICGCGSVFRSTEHLISFKKFLRYASGLLKASAFCTQLNLKLKTVSLALFEWAKMETTFN